MEEDVDERRDGHGRGPRSRIGFLSLVPSLVVGILVAELHRNDTCVARGRRRGVEARTRSARRGGSPFPRGEVSRWASISAMNWTRAQCDRIASRKVTRNVCGVSFLRAGPPRLHSPLSRSVLVHPLGQIASRRRERVVARGQDSDRPRGGRGRGPLAWPSPSPAPRSCPGALVVLGGGGGLRRGWARGARRAPARRRPDRRGIRIVEGCVGDSRSGPPRAERASARRW